MRSQLSQILLLTLLSAISALSIGCSEDATTAPAVLETGPASIQIIRFGDPVSGARVLLQSRNGAVLDQSVSDADGMVDFEITSGDMITSIVWSDGGPQLATYVGLQPGDQVQSSNVYAPDGEPSEKVMFTGDIYEPRDTFIFGTGCSSGGGRPRFPYSTYIYDACKANSGKLHAQVHTKLDGAKSAFAYVTDVPYDASGTTTIDWTGMWRTDWQDVDVQIPTTWFDVNSFSISPWPVRDGVTFANLETLFVNSGEVIPPSHQLRVPRAFPEFLEIGLQFNGPNGESASLNQRKQLTERDTEFRFDVEIPSVEILDVDTTDPARPKVQWKISSVGDLVALTLSWTVEAESSYWTIYLPPRVSSFKLPSFPPELEYLAPPAPELTERYRVSVGMLDDSTVNDAAAARQAPTSFSTYRSTRTREGHRVNTRNSIVLVGGADTVTDDSPLYKHREQVLSEKMRHSYSVE